MWSSPKISQKRKKDILEAVIEALDESEQGGESSGTEYWLVTVLDTQKDRLSKKRRIKETP